MLAFSVSRSYGVLLAELCSVSNEEISGRRSKKEFLGERFRAEKKITQSSCLPALTTVARGVMFSDVAALLRS